MACGAGGAAGNDPIQGGNHYTFCGGRIFIGAWLARASAGPHPSKAPAEGSDHCRQVSDLACANQPPASRTCDPALFPGPDWKSLLVTALLLTIPAGVFIGLVAVDLGQRLSWVIFGFSVVIVLFPVAMLANTALRDPGFIPRKPFDETANL